MVGWGADFIPGLAGAGVIGCGGTGSTAEAADTQKAHIAVRQFSFQRMEILRARTIVLIESSSESSTCQGRETEESKQSCRVRLESGQE
jgi:hypothetical protein